MLHKVSKKMFCEIRYQRRKCVKSAISPIQLLMWNKFQVCRNQGAGGLQHSQILSKFDFLQTEKQKMKIQIIIIKLGLFKILKSLLPFVTLLTWPLHVMLEIRFYWPILFAFYIYSILFCHSLLAMDSSKNNLL